MTDDYSLAQWALAYAQGGLPVFPLYGIQNGRCTCGKPDCEHQGKHPCTLNGFKAATTDEHTIRAWWGRWPNANIGFSVRNRIILDIDGPEGEKELAALEKEHGALPKTRAARTGRGLHLYFKPNGKPVRCSAGKLGKHLDIRTDGGYVILPPSVHVCGKKYEWVRDIKSAALPEWVSNLLTDANQRQTSSSEQGEEIPKGQRNAHLTSLAGSMRRGGMSQAAIEKALLEDNKRCNPPLPESEVRQIAKSVGRYEPAARAPGASHGEVISIPKLRGFSSIESEPLRWLWPGRIPLGKLTLIAGDPGLGKSLLTIDLAARVSTGMNFPDGAACERGETILLSAEDDAGDTVRPRLDEADADVSHIHLLEAVRNVTADGKSVEKVFNLERDIDALEDAISQTGARLVIVDPISAYLGGTDSHANADVRGLLAPLAALAVKYRVAVVAVTHLRKSSGAAIYRAMGSLAFAAAARAVLGVVADPDGKTKRLLLSVKQNLAPDSGGLAYRIESPNGMARIAWQPGAVAVDVNVVMGGFENREEHSERREAEEWLRDFLGDGPRAASEVRTQSRQVGLSWITVRRAADAVGVRKQKIGGRGAGWEWSLPDEPKDAHPIHSGMSTFEQSSESKEDQGQSKVKDAHVSNTEHL